MLEEILEKINLEYDEATTIHLAVFSGPYFDYIVEGKKTIESRFSKNKILPYQKIKTKDIVIVKQSSGPVVGYFYAGDCLFFDFTKDNINEVFKKYQEPLCIDDEFINAKQNSNYATLINVEKYEYECFIAKYCYDYDIPILGICAGKHCLVRGVGGSIGRLNDDSHEKDDEYVHSIKLEHNSKIYQIIGQEEIMVNSRHTGYSENLSILKCSALSPDGIDEVVEDTNHTFYIGVQFHPESLYLKDENMNKIFKSFIAAAKSKKELQGKVL